MKLTQGQVAKAMDWSLSKVMRIEKGEVNVAPSDLRVLMDYLEIVDPDQVQSLLDDARVSRQERWTVDPADREFLTPAMIELYQFEAESIAVRMYTNYTVPGRLQTRAYAEAMLRPYREIMGDEMATARIDARIRHQEIMYRPQAPLYMALLDESVLLRPVGGSAVLGEQLDHIVRMIDETSLRVRIVPFQNAATLLQFYGPFVLCDLEEARSAFLYRENGQVDDAVRDVEEIGRHRAIFDQLWSAALDDNTTRARITSAAAALGSGGG